MKNFKRFGFVSLVVLAAALAGTEAANAALSGDYAGFDTAVSTAVTGATGAISAVALLKIGPGVLKWGYNKVIGWFR